MKVFVTKVAGCRPVTLQKLTLSQICFKNSRKIATFCLKKWIINMQLQSSGYASNERKQIAKFDFPLKCCMFLFLGQKSLFLVGGLLRVEI